MLKIISNASDQREVSFPRFTFVPARSTNFFFFPPECTTNSFSKIITNYEDQASPTLSIIDSFYPNNKSLNSTRNLIPSIHRESSNIDQFIIISSTKNFPRGFHPDRRKKEGKKEKKDNIPPLSVAIERDLPRFPPPPPPPPPPLSHDKIFTPAKRRDASINQASSLETVEFWTQAGRARNERAWRGTRARVTTTGLWTPGATRGKKRKSRESKRDTKAHTMGRL